jgi:hypothetical protein
VENDQIKRESHTRKDIFGSGIVMPSCAQIGVDFKPQLWDTSEVQRRRNSGKDTIVSDFALTDLARQIMLQPGPIDN